jgi:purine-binding chemotaxis protein CheW
MPAYIEGLMPYRATVIPVVNFSAWSGHPLSAESEESRMVVLEWKGRLYGLAVEQVCAVVRLPIDGIEAVGVMPTGIKNNFVYGITRWNGAVVTVLQLDAILTEMQIQHVW